MRTGREVEALRRLLDETRAACERFRVAGPEEDFLQAYVAVKSLELRLHELLRQPVH